MNNQRWLSMSFFVFFFTWGIFLPYWTGWLTSAKGLSVTDASIIMGAGMIARSFSTFFLFPLAMQNLSLLRVIRWTTLLSFVIALSYLPESPFYVLFGLTVLFSAVYPVILPSVESGASLLMQSERIHYGKSRSYGSIGYTIALLLIGIATAVWDEQAILYMMIAGLAAALLFFFRQAPVALQQPPIKNTAAANSGQLKSLFSNKPFVLVLFISILLQGAHASYYNYGFIFLDDMGINGFYIGIILNIAVLFEILFFTQADRLLANVRTSTVFLLAAAGSTVRWVAIFLFPVTSVFIATQALHSVSFGMAHFAFIQYISKNLPHSLIASAQGVYAAVAMSLSVAILTFPAGYLYDLSPRYAFLSMAVCSVAALFLILWSKQRITPADK
ncbi:MULTISPECIES: MFS transporter [unclassified Sporosarcina]|uniref:MFS transporter n=1 Tax=unclassified Sporosarcina TaxID=2647733 RepID=UPI00203D6A08|nr:MULTISPECIES: MFS transporter [unclassified Sporosarcina]GKV65460.1 MFS transporter [Sporosarcina sp. NCCP-2331]GLB55584.1 MFS transporter [Sporosarcina sp. NCCP-2378]